MRYAIKTTFTKTRNPKALAILLCTDATRQDCNQMLRFSMQTVSLHTFLSLWSQSLLLLILISFLSVRHVVLAAVASCLDPLPEALYRAEPRLQIR
eukprot:620258-Amphidinium_carterae.1